MLQRNFILSLLPLFIISGLGFLVSYAYSQGRFVRWQNLGVPTAKAIRFNAIRYADEDQETPILITTDSDGTHHIGSTNNCAQFDSCWQQRENSSIIDAWGGPAGVEHCENNPNLALRMPENTVKCISSFDIMGGSHLVRHAYFAQTEDGNVHVWSFIPGRLILPIFVAFILLGFIVTGFVWSRADNSAEQ